MCWKRPGICQHHAHMLKHMCAWCRYTRGRFECTHGDVLDGTHGGEGREVIVSSAHQNLPTWGYHVPQKPMDLTHFQFEAKSCTTTAYRWLCRDSHLSLITLWSAVFKSPKFSARGTTPPVRLLHGALVILVLMQISQFGSFGKWVLILCRPDTTFPRGSEDNSREELEASRCSGTLSSTWFSLNSFFKPFWQITQRVSLYFLVVSIFVCVFGDGASRVFWTLCSTRFSVNSSNHSGASSNGFLRTLSWSFLFVFSASAGSCDGLPVLCYSYSHFSLIRDAV